MFSERKALVSGIFFSQETDMCSGCTLVRDGNVDTFAELTIAFVWRLNHNYSEYSYLDCNGIYSRIVPTYDKSYPWWNLSLILLVRVQETRISRQRFTIKHAGRNFTFHFCGFVIILSVFVDGVRRDQSPSGRSEMTQYDWLESIAHQK